MSAATTAVMGRRMAESLMVDTVTIERATGATVLDPVDLSEVPEYAPQHTGKARIQRSNALSPQDDVAGGFEFGVNGFIAQLPLDVTGILPGDRLTVTAVGDVTDPDLLGLVGTVRANLTKTHPTKRTLVCEAVT